MITLSQIAADPSFKSLNRGDQDEVVNQFIENNPDQFQGNAGLVAKETVRLGRELESETPLLKPLKVREVEALRDLDFDLRQEGADAKLSLNKFTSAITAIAKERADILKSSEEADELAGKFIEQSPEARESSRKSGGFFSDLQGGAAQLVEDVADAISSDTGNRSLKDLDRELAGNTRADLADKIPDQAVINRFKEKNGRLPTKEDLEAEESFIRFDLAGEAIANKSQRQGAVSEKFNGELEVNPIEVLALDDAELGEALSQFSGQAAARLQKRLPLIRRASEQRVREALIKENGEATDELENLSSEEIRKIIKDRRDDSEFFKALDLGSTKALRAAQSIVGGGLSLLAPEEIGQEIGKANKENQENDALLSELSQPGEAASFGSDLIGLAPDVAIGFASAGAGGLLAKGLKVKNAASVAKLATSAGAGASGGLRVFDQALGAGLDKEDAFVLGLKSAAVTGAITLAGSGSGLEKLQTQLATKTGADKFKEGIKGYLKSGLDGFTKDGLEEVSDELLQSVLIQSEINPNGTIDDAVQGAVQAFFLGGALGGASGLASNSITPRNQDSQEGSVDQGEVETEEVAEVLEVEADPAAPVALEDEADPVAPEAEASPELVEPEPEPSALVVLENKSARVVVEEQVSDDGESATLSTKVITKPVRGKDLSPLPSGSLDEDVESEYPQPDLPPNEIGKTEEQIDAMNALTPKGEDFPVDTDPVSLDPIEEDGPTFPSQVNVNDFAVGAASPSELSPLGEVSFRPNQFKDTIQKLEDDGRLLGDSARNVMERQNQSFSMWVEEAQDTIDQSPSQDAAIDQVMSDLNAANDLGEEFRPADIMRSGLLLQRMDQEVRRRQAAGDVKGAAELNDKREEFITSMAEMATEKGRGLVAFQAFARLTPDGQFQKLKRDIEKVFATQTDGTKTNVEVETETAQSEDVPTTGEVNVPILDTDTPEEAQVKKDISDKKDLEQTNEEDDALMRWAKALAPYYGQRGLSDFEQEQRANQKKRQTFYKELVRRYIQGDAIQIDNLVEAMAADNVPQDVIDVAVSSAQQARAVADQKREKKEEVKRERELLKEQAREVREAEFAASKFFKRLAKEVADDPTAFGMQIGQDVEQRKAIVAQYLVSELGISEAEAKRLTQAKFGLITKEIDERIEKALLKKQGLDEASLDAWIKSIEPDFNPSQPNQKPFFRELVSRYIKGEQVSIETLEAELEKAGVPKDKAEKALDNAQQRRGLNDLERDQKAEKRAQLAVEAEQAREKAEADTAANRFMRALVDGAWKDLTQGGLLAFADQKQRQKILADALVEEMGIGRKAADDMAARKIAQFNAEVTRRRKQELKILVDRKQQVGVLSENKGQKLLKAINAAETLEDFSKIVIPGVTVDQQTKDRITALAKKAAESPDGRLRKKAIQDLHVEMSKVQDTDLAAIIGSFWYANILMGPSTQAVNVFGSGIATLARTSASVLVNNPSDSVALMKGLASSLKLGFREGAAALQGVGVSKDLAKFDVGVDALESLQTDFRGQPFRQKVKAALSLWKFVFRSLQAADGAFYVTALEGRSHMVANRISRLEGLSGPAKATRVADILHNSDMNYAKAKVQAETEVMSQFGELDSFKAKNTVELRALEIQQANRPEALVEESRRFGELVTFTQSPEGSLGVVASLTNELINSIGLDVTWNGKKYGRVKPLKPLIPFVNIVANVGNTALDYSPFGIIRGVKGSSIFVPTEAENNEGIFNMMRNAGASHRRQFHGPEAKENVAAGILGSSVAGFIALLAQEGLEDDDPWFAIYSEGPGDFNKRRQMENEGWQPHSIKIGNSYFRYNETPLTFVFSAVGSLHDKIRYDKNWSKDQEVDMVEKINVAFAGAARGFAETSFLTSLSDTLDLLTGKEQGGRKQTLTKSAGRISKGFIPGHGLLRDMSRIMDPAVIDKADGWSTFVSDIPVVKRMGTRPALNFFGQEARHQAPLLGIPSSSRFVGERTEHPEFRFLAENRLWLPAVPREVTVAVRNANKGQKRLVASVAKKDLPAIVDGVLTEDVAYLFHRDYRGPLELEAVQSLMVNEKFGSLSQGDKQLKLSQEVKRARNQAKLKMIRDLYNEGKLVEKD